MIEALRPSQSFDTTPTEKQQQASDPNASVWVNASAGSGKTTVLTHRVMRLLLSNVKPEKILCLTFTRAAAAEMANRITAKLSYWATCSDNELNASLSDLQGFAPDSKQMTDARRLFAAMLACPGGMRIRTLHAFCQEVLRRFPLEAGLPPHFTVIEENDAYVLQQETLHNLLRQAVDNPDTEIAGILNTLVQGLGESKLTDALQALWKDRTRLQSMLACVGGIDQFISNIRRQLELEPDETRESIIIAAIRPEALPEDDLKRVAHVLLKSGVRARKRGEELAAWLTLSPAERQDRFINYADSFFTEKGEFFKSYTDTKTNKLMPEAEDILRLEATRLLSVRERLETAETAARTASLIRFGAALMQGYEQRKKQQAALDYDDLIDISEKLLQRSGIAPWILYKLDGGLDHLLVDEAQDTSRAQWRIVAALADEFFAGVSARTNRSRTLFVVGDEKQSIFSFQRADPEAFREMKGYFERRITEAEKHYAPVSMRVSYRSAPAILQAVDTIFAAAANVNGVSAEKVEHRAAEPKPGQALKSGRVEIWPLLKSEKRDNDALWYLPVVYQEEHDPQAELARMIATKIKNIVDSRQAQPGNIMVLLRRRGRFADLMVRALKKHAIPVTGVDRMRLVKQLAVMDVLALLQFALLPEDDLNLAAVLRGPLLDISEDDLLHLAARRSGSLWQSLRGYADEKTFTAAHHYLQSLLGQTDFTSPFMLLSNIINQACPANSTSGKKALAGRLGTEAFDPIEELLNAAQNFSRRHAPSLQGFLHWLQASEADIKRELDQGGGQVRIMTVHAAKGLEAPIVFLPDSASVPRATDLPKFMWGDDDVPIYIARRPIGVVLRRLWDEARQKQMQEYRRLFYVALTRAANNLYICGWEGKRFEGNSAQSWHALALTALQDSHQPFLATGTEPLPLVVLADTLPKHSALQETTHPTIIPNVVLPVWAQSLPTPEAESVTPLNPSRMAQVSATASPDGAFARGRIIHRLLQSLPDVEDDQRHTTVRRFLANPKHQLSATQQDEIASEVLTILSYPDCAPFFAAGSRAEVALAGKVGNELVSGQIDRLCFVGDAVWILDYKTNRPPPLDVRDVPEVYQQQLRSYHLLLQAAYPGKAVRCFLLWTYSLRLMELF